MTTTTIPQREGEWTAEEALASSAVHLSDPNEASNDEIAQRAVKLVSSVIMEWTQRMRGLHRRWRATWYMLTGNTLERGGPEDVHVPEIYKAMETIIPRAEEMVLGEEPWFKVIPRKKAERRLADALEAYIDWQFAQTNLRSLIQPAIRDMLVTQTAVFYAFWDNREAMRNIRTVEKKWTKDGRVERKVHVKRKKVVDFAGTRVRLVDPIDFIVDTKATNPQDAVYVGHRAWLTIDEIRRIGKEQGWVNLDKLDEKNTNTLGTVMDFYSWPRDPASRYGNRQDQIQKVDERVEKLEVIVLYIKADFHGSGVHDDYRVVIAGGKTALEVRKNPHDGQFRPYAVMRVTKSGHEFYGIGPFDNAIRLNQHLDRYWQTTMRGANLAGQPMVFAEEDSELPDSLYRVAPGKVFKGVGNVRFTQIPDGFLRSSPLIISLWQKNLEETVGSFRINMGQDTGGTATEASLSLQEGNRRMRGIVRSIGDGLESLLELTYKLTCQHSSEDVEFPVLGKRAIDMKRSHLTVGPADLLDDVKFELVGLRNTRNYGLKATGLQAFVNAMTPFIMANPQAVEQVSLMHEFARELIGPDEADRIVKVPTPIDQLMSQEDENEGLIQGEKIPVDPDDDDEEHIKAMEPLWERASDPNSNMPQQVRLAVVEHRLLHMQQAVKKNAQAKARQARMPQSVGALPPQAGGQVSPETGRASPSAGGFSDAMTQLANEPGGQTPGENPGPADSRKYSRSGGSKRTTNQTENG